MTLTTDAGSAEVIVTPPPEIDMATGDLLARRIERARALRPDRVVVDFAAVTFCDSTAVSVLLSALTSLEGQGCALLIRNPSPLLQRMAAILGASAIFGIPSQAGSLASGHGSGAFERSSRGSHGRP